ncbi:MAG: DUF2007 domain-containing protein [Bacteroidota bacterium]
MDYIDIYESFNVAELQLIKHALKSENIEFKVFNETLLQAANAEAMGYSGARIQVHVMQVAEANRILREHGFKGTSSEGEEQFVFMRQFTAFTDRVPLLNRLYPPFRLVVGLMILTLLIFGILFSPLAS